MAAQGIETKVVKVVSDGDVETFLDGWGDGRDLLYDVSNDVYMRLYVNPDPQINKPSPLDPYWPALKAALGLGDGRFEYVLVHFSW